MQTTPLPSSSLPEEIEQIIGNCRAYFATGVTKTCSFRLAALSNLEKAIIANEKQILAALYSDFRKGEYESIASEISLVISEVREAKKNLHQWMKPRKVGMPFFLFPASARIEPEPLGVCLIIGPWNYPIQLILSPLVAAIAAGNCVLIKPSELAPATSQIIAKMLAGVFEKSLVSVIEGGIEVSKILLEQCFDHIFFTGSPSVGKIVMAAAAKHLTPTILELGGKSPCVVDTNINLQATAKRIVWGKFFNAGQTCVAPDYVLTTPAVKELLIPELKKAVTELYGENPQISKDYCRIINDNHFSRLKQYLSEGKVIIGGAAISAERYISPTIIDNVSLDSPIMQEEIFGPILPIITVQDLRAAIFHINSHEKPLTIYLFSQNQDTIAKLTSQTSSGSVCINDTLVQLTAPKLPFGGVGMSGMGRYHGRSGFEAFSNHKSILKRSFFLDLKLRYPSHKYNTKLFRTLFRL